MGCLQLYAAKGKRISNALISLQRFALFSSDGTTKPEDAEGLNPSYLSFFHRYFAIWQGGDFCVLGWEREHSGNYSRPGKPPSDVAESEESQRGQFLAEHQQQCGGILMVVSHLLHHRQAPTESSQYLGTDVFFLRLIELPSQGSYIIPRMEPLASHMSGKLSH